MMLVRQIAAFNSCGTRWGCVVHQMLKFRSANSVGAKNKTSCARSNLKLSAGTAGTTLPLPGLQVDIASDSIKCSRMSDETADPTLVHKLQGLKEGVHDVAFHPKVWKYFLFHSRCKLKQCVNCRCTYDWSRFVKWLQLVTTEPYKLGTLSTPTSEHTSKSSTLFDGCSSPTLG